MARTYVVKRGDTLRKIAESQFGDGDMAPGIVKVFESFGFTWGGRWAGAGKDPMHFQFCSGY